MNQQRQKRPAIEVMAEVQAACPNLVPHMFMDGAWIWYCGPSLKEHPKLREALSNIGFRFAKRGHVMPDKQTRGYWGHSCDRPTRTHRHRKGGTPLNHHQQEEPEPPAYDPAELLAAL